MKTGYTIGCDYGTLSMRAVLVRLEDGAVLAEHVYEYPDAVITDRLPGSEVELKGPGWALQNPDDWLDALCTNVPAVIQEAGVNKEDILGLSVDFTTCTVLPMDEQGNVLCQLPQYRNRPHAWPKLWKNHTAATEAEAFTALDAEKKYGVLDDYGFRASSEFFFPKLLKTLHDDPEVYNAAYTFMEGGDYVTYKMTGELNRSSCLAAAKAQYDCSGRGYPPKEFFRDLDPRFENVVEDKHLGNIVTIGQRAGYLQPEMAEKLGLKAGMPVAIAHADAAIALIGAGVTKPNEITFIMGTSTCHMMTAETKEQIPGMFGVYKDGILPDCYTYEAGQSAVGDIFDWFCRRMVPQSYFDEANARGVAIQKVLDEKAGQIPVGASGIMALDWMNGNRSILQDADLTGMIMGLTLSTKAEEVYRALIEATAFGTRVIMEAFQEYNVPVNKIFACGGLAHKSPVLMQIYADVLNAPITVTAVKQTSALSAAIFAAVAVGEADGGYDTFEDAVAHMVQPPKCVYTPNPENVPKYDQLYKVYRAMHDYLGAANSPMKELRRIQRENIH